MSNVTRLDYCQFLLSSQTNYTLTYFADHTERFSHDAVNRYLRGEKLTARLLWENVREQVVVSEHGYLVFDDTVIDKNSSFQIELVRRQYSGNAHQVIKGIGVVTCVYINPERDQFWVIDYRIYAPDGDGKSKLDHVGEMLNRAIGDKALPVRAVLMDTWYAERKLLLHIERLNLLYYCPLKSNRLVDDSDGQQPYQRIDALEWDETDSQQGKVLHIKAFPKGHRVRLFRLVLSTERTDYVATNDKAQTDAQDTQEVCALRWKIEQLHRESKQLTGLEGCQCRNARIQRNHIGCAFLVWVRLKAVAQQTQRTIYQVKRELLDDYMCQQLRSPTIKMILA
ncbi:MAG TPA: transposase [Nitrososphaera sp.]|jgi:SRSO17 transposase|nr:transposase [Nitrososphaera sp.]